VFERLHEATRPFLNFLGVSYFPIMATLLILLMVFLVLSRRLGAHAEEPTRRRMMRLLGLALEPDEKASAKKPRNKKGAAKRKPPAPPLPPAVLGFLQEIKLHRLLLRIDWLIHVKLKPRLSIAMMILIPLTATLSSKRLLESNAMLLTTARNVAVQPSRVWEGFFLMTFFLALTLLPLFLVRKNRELYFDMAALCYLLLYGYAKLAYCWNVGCCFGKPWREGVYCATLETAVFPVQLLEFFLLILLAVISVIYMLYGKSYQPGRGCSLALLSYAVMRFFIEFLRYHDSNYRRAEANVFLGLTMMQVICVAMAVLAVAWRFALPLEKKLMDRFSLFLAGHLGYIGRVRFFAKWKAWRNSAAAR